MKFSLAMPPSINETYRNRGNITYKTAKAREWEEEVGWAFKSIYHGTGMSDQPMTVILDFYFKRDRDIDSGIKILLDFLQTRLYKNDRQIDTLIVTKHIQTAIPHVDVEIYETSQRQADSDVFRARAPVGV